MDFKRFRGQSAWRLVASCAALWYPVPPVGSGLDPLYIKILDSGGVDLEAEGLDAGCWQDWRGLEAGGC